MFPIAPILYFTLLRAPTPIESLREYEEKRVFQSAERIRGEIVYSMLDCIEHSPAGTFSLQWKKAFIFLLKQVFQSAGRISKKDEPAAFEAV